MRLVYQTSPLVDMLPFEGVTKLFKITKLVLISFDQTSYQRRSLYNSLFQLSFSLQYVVNVNVLLPVSELCLSICILYNCTVSHLTRPLIYTCRK